MSESAEKAVLPHHVQQPLCTTRLPYRQGRKLTAVKVYTITTESNHLLAFGVPALNLRREAKTLFLKFGHLQQFHISKDHPGEIFTETYHAAYDSIQSARVAKRMLDTKSFYGGILHICYAPELENLQETRQKITQRRKDVVNRLRNLDKEKKNQLIEDTKVKDIQAQIDTKNYGTTIHNEIKTDHKKLDMGTQNTIYINKKRKTKKKVTKDGVHKKSKTSDSPLNTKVDVVDFTSTEKMTLSNINEGLNYNKFGNEVIRAVEAKPVNIIKFNIKK